MGFTDSRHDNIGVLGMAKQIFGSGVSQGHGGVFTLASQKQSEGATNGKSAANDGYFDKSDFKIDLRAKTATCPAGQSIPIALGQVARFNPETCAACPLRVICTSAAASHGRTLSIDADQPLQRRLRKLSDSRSGRIWQRARVAIEHRLAHHAQKQGRFARYRGLRKNLLDSRRHAAILNLEVLHARQAA